MLGFLENSGWLASQPQGLREWAADVAKVKSFKSGQYLYKAGDEPDGIYGLKSGSVEIEFPLLANEPVSLIRTNEGFWIGDSALLSKTNRIVSVLSVEESTFVFLPGHAVRKLLAESPEYWQSFYDLSARNTHLAVTLLAEALSLTVRARASRALLHLSKGRLEAHITQDSLANYLGIARPTVRRCLANLTKLGAIEPGYGKIRIKDKTLLASFENEQ